MKKIALLSLFLVSHACHAMEVDISGIDKKMLLQSLYTHAKSLGFETSSATQGLLSNEEMESILTKGDIGYLNDKVMKINISGDSVNTILYNRDNGEDAAEKIIEALRK